MAKSQSAQRLKKRRPSEWLPLRRQSELPPQLSNATMAGDFKVVTFGKLRPTRKRSAEVAPASQPIFAADDSASYYDPVPGSAPHSLAQAHAWRLLRKHPDWCICVPKAISPQKVANDLNKIRAKGDPLISADTIARLLGRRRK